MYPGVSVVFVERYCADKDKAARNSTDHSRVTLAYKRRFDCRRRRNIIHIHRESKKTGPFFI